MNDETLNVVRVISSAKNTPEVESTADDRIATGAENGPELEEQHEEDQHQRQQQHDDEIAERFLLLLVGAAVLHANRRRQLQIVDRLLHGRHARPQVDAFQPRRHFDVALQVLAQDFGLAGQLVDRRPASRASPSRRSSSRASCCSWLRATRDRPPGKRTRSVYGRSLMITGVVAGSPSTIADATVSSSSVVKPAFARASAD